jgi:NADPH:quinone reductase-like Zn-dependent oxidoreductase
MRAVVHRRYGGPDVLRIEDVERPAPRDDEVLVRVHATTVNRTDCGFRKAEPSSSARSAARSGRGGASSGPSWPAEGVVGRQDQQLSRTRASARTWHAAPCPSSGEIDVKAMTQHRYGTADVLALEDIDPPAMADDEILIRVRAAGVGPDVWHLVTGRPYLVRAMGFGVRRPKTPVPGRDVSGTVEAVGATVTTCRPGDEVFGTCAGALAEVACARPEAVTPKPANLTFEQAAAVPVSGCAALRGLRDAGAIRAGQSVLVIGASGGVGTFAVQIAKAFGTHVTGVCSTTKTELVRSLGADRVIDYTREDVVDGGDRYDLILDTAGRRPLSRLRRALAPRGTLVLVGGEGGGRWTGGFQRQLRAVVVSRFARQRLRALMSSEPREDLLFLKDLIEARTVTPVIGATYPLADAAKALGDATEGHGRGKAVVSV